MFDPTIIFTSGEAPGGNNANTNTATGGTATGGTATGGTATGGTGIGTGGTATGVGTGGTGTGIGAAGIATLGSNPVVTGGALARTGASTRRTVSLAVMALALGGLLLLATSNVARRIAPGFSGAAARRRY
jgi:hypothetical protein